MDEPVPIRRAVVGCLLVAVIGLALALLIRPFIFSLAPARDDGAITLASASEVASAPIRRDVLLTQSYGWDGELDAGDGRVQIGLIIGQSSAGEIVVVNAASPVADDCAVDIGADRLVDCDGRAWTFDGLPLDSNDPPLQQFDVEVTDGSVVADLTRSADD
jgi:hypothetical protein